MANLLNTVPTGATVGLVAPAGPCDPSSLALATNAIRSLGFAPKAYPGCSARFEYLAGTDEQRLSDLHAAFGDDEVRIVWCIKGGYGCARLLDRMDLELIKRNPKPLVGYSDVTALHSVLSNLGLFSFHAPMPVADLNAVGAEFAIDLCRMLGAGLHAGDVIRPSASFLPGLSTGTVAEGKLVGGNLSVLCSLVGTPYLPQIFGNIVFLEDVGEDPYRVDRMLTQLRLSGVLQQAAGFLLGGFTGAEFPTFAVQDLLMTLGKPVLAGWPSGHTVPNQALPMGAKVKLDVQRQELVLREDVVLLR